MKKKPSRCELWRRKLSYLVQHHGALHAIAVATCLKPASIERMVRRAPAAGAAAAPALAQASVRQIETALDLPDGWFDASVFLPSRL